jgi:type II secretory pathway component PulC
MGNQSRIKSAVRHINVLNLLLLTIAAALAAHVLPPLLNVGVSYTPPAPKKIAEGKEEKPAAVQSPSAMEYTVIADQNVFNPERKIPPEKKDEKPLPKPEFVLYGTLITDDASIAFLDDLKAPYTTPGRGKRQKTLRIGNSLSGYTLSEVYADRVVMVRGEDRMELRVIDPSHAKARESGGGPAGAVAAAQQAPAAGIPQVSSPAAAAQRPGGPAASSTRAARVAQQRQRQSSTPPPQ